MTFNENTMQTFSNQLIAPPQDFIFFKPIKSGVDTSHQASRPTVQKKIKSPSPSKMSKPSAMNTSVGVACLSKAQPIPEMIMMGLHNDTCSNSGSSEGTAASSDDEHVRKTTTAHFPNFPSNSSDSILKNRNQPVLHFVNSENVSAHVVLMCKEGFIENDSKKAPPETTHNVTIRDTIYIESKLFKDCICKLKLKDGSPDGATVLTEVLKPNNSNHGSTFECSVSIPQKVTSMKGSSSSRIGYIEISHIKTNEIIAVSSFFWIRSRSRLQLSKDNKRKVSGTTSDHKRKREEESVVSEVAPTVKSVKVEDSTQPTLPVAAVSNSNTLPPISSLVSATTSNFDENTVRFLFGEVFALRDVVKKLSEEVEFLKRRENK